MTDSSGDGLFPFDLFSLASADLGPRADAADRAKGRRSRFATAIRREARRAAGSAAGRLFAMRGWAAFCAGRRSEALKELDKARRSEEANPVYRVWTGAVYKSMENWPSALEEFTAAIALEPKAVIAYFGRAEVLRNLGRREDSLADALKAAELQPESAAAWRFVAKHRDASVHAARVLEDLERAVALDPSSSEGHAWRGEALARLGRDADALRSFARALRSDPRYELAYLWRAAVLLRRGEAKRALADLSRAARLHPGRARTQGLIGQALRRGRRFAAAEDAFTRALALDRGYAWAYHQRFLLRKARGRWDAALRDLQRAFSLDAKYGWFEAGESALADYDRRLESAERELAARRGPRAGFWRERIRAERDGRRALPAPEMEAEKSYDVMLGYACNVLCRFCSQDLDWRKDGWLPLSVAREQVFLAYRRGCRILNLLGGEVTVYPDVLALVSFARKVGFETVQFETNGIRLADRSFAAALADAGLTRVSVSVHAASAAAHDHLVKAPGAFEKLLRGIDHLNSLGVAVRVAFVLNRLNYRELARFCRFFWTEKKVAEFQFIYPLYTGDFLNHLDEMAVPISAVVPALEEAFALLEKLGCPKPPNIHNVPPCFFPARLGQMGDWQDVGMEVLKPDGKRYRDTAQTPLYRKQYAANCSRCSLRERCVGIDPAYLRRWGEAEIRPVLRGSPTARGPRKA